MSVLFNVSDPRVNGSFVKPQVALYRHNRREGYTCILRLFKHKRRTIFQNKLLLKVLNIMIIKIILKTYT